MKTTTITTYTCDYCGRVYDDMAKASECEKRCASVAANNKKKESRNNEIDIMVNNVTNALQKYYDDYGEFPKISFKVNKNLSNNSPRNLAKEFFLF